MSPNAKDVTGESEFLKVMSVGLAGSGKSIFASTFPTPGFVFDFGSQIVSYKGLDFDYEQYPISPVGWDKFGKDLEMVKKAVTEGKYQTVIIDDLTAMGDVCMEKALQLDPKRSPTNGPVWNVHYSMVRNLMEGKLRQLINFPANIVFIAHLNIIQDQETGVILGTEPLMVGQLSIRIPSYFDEVYIHTTRKEGGETKWVMQTVPVGYNHGRSRLSGKARLLPDVIENDYKVVMDYITGRRKKAVKPPTTPQSQTQTQPKTT